MFDHTDFVQNPKKYELFKTAEIAKNVFTNNGENDLPEGEIVGIQYFTTARNQIYRRMEPVYSVTVNGKFWGQVYANTLRNFVL